MGLILDITKIDRATPMVVKVGDALKSSPETRRVFGRAVVPVVKDHFHQLESASQNPLGKSGYWDKAAQSVQQPEVKSDGVGIGVTKEGVGLHLFGGTVKPGKNISRKTGRPTQYMTISARSEAYAKRAGEFDNLRIVFGKGRKPIALAESDSAPSFESHVQFGRSGVARRVRVQKPVGTSGGIIMFWLVKQVTIRGNPNVVPKLTDMTTPAFEACLQYLERLVERRATRA